MSTEVTPMTETARRHTLISEEGGKVIVDADSNVVDDTLRIRPTLVEAILWQETKD